MIGAPLSERYGLGPLDGARAAEVLRAALGTVGASLVEVRRQDPRMIACLVVSADKHAVRLCRQLGLEIKPGGTGVVGLLGADAVRLFPGIAQRHRAWLETPCGARETKVLLVRGGFALLSVDTTGGTVAITAAQ